MFGLDEDTYFSAPGTMGVHGGMPVSSVGVYDGLRGRGLKKKALEIGGKLLNTVLTKGKDLAKKGIAVGRQKLAKTIRKSRRRLLRKGKEMVRQVIRKGKAKAKSFLVQNAEGALQRVKKVPVNKAVSYMKRQAADAIRASEQKMNTREPDSLTNKKQALVTNLRRVNHDIGNVRRPVPKPRRIRQVTTSRHRRPVPKPRHSKVVVSHRYDARDRRRRYKLRAQNIAKGVQKAGNVSLPMGYL